MEQEIAFVRCNKCECLHLHSESEQFCCSSGDLLLAQEDRNVPHQFVDFFSRHRETIYCHSRTINHHACISSVGSISEQGTFGNLRQDSEQSLLRCDGRIFHFKVDPLTRDGSHPLLGSASSYIFYDPLSTTLHDINHFGRPVLECILEFRSLLSQHNVYISRLPNATIWALLDRTAIGHIVLNEPLPQQDQEVVALHNERFNVLQASIPFQQSPNVIDSQYEAFSYPLKDPFGVSGWHSRKRFPSGKKMTIHSYAKATILQSSLFKLMPRLGQEWALDMLARHEKNTSNFFIQRQNLRICARSEVLATRNLNCAGTRWLLPSSCRGSPAQKAKQVTEGLALCAAFGAPTLFITFTANVEWPQIHFLSEGASWCSRPDVVNRVFREKLTSFIKDLWNGSLFPTKATYVQYVIEFQLRGIPHAHILVRLDGNELTTALDVDSIVSARLETPCPLYLDGCACDTCSCYKTVRKFMLHTCVPARCFTPPRGDAEKKICKYGFPKRPEVHTFMDDKCFWHLRRTVGDAQVVAHHRKSLIKYNAHINVEVAAGTRSVWYLRKYMSKIPPHVSAKLATCTNLRDQYDLFFKLQSISAGEAIWILLGFNMNYFSPSVELLPVHSADTNAIVFDPDDAQDVDRALSKATALEMYFARPEQSMFDDLKYEDYHSRFIVASRASRNFWLDLYGNRVFQRTTQHVAIMRHVDAHAIEHFALRRILKHFPSRSFAEILGVSPTFSAAAVRLGILRNLDDAVWELMMVEHVEMLRPPSAFVRSFVMLLINCVGDAGGIFNSFWRYMVPPGCSIDEALRAVDNLLMREARTLTEFESRLPIVTTARWATSISRKAKIYFAQSISDINNRPAVTLSLDQSNAIAKAMVAIESGHSLYINGSAGTGKTAVLCELAKIVVRTKKLLITAYTGVACCELPRAMTIHSIFKIPVLETETSDQTALAIKCYVGGHSFCSSLLRNVDVIIIDEFSLVNIQILDVIDITLKELRNNSTNFGGVSIIAAGDFKQCCPIVRCNAEALESETFRVSVLNSPLWNTFEIFSITTSQRHANDEQFADYCESIGSGKVLQIDLEDCLQTFKQPNEAEQWCDDNNATMLSFHNVHVAEHNQITLEKKFGDTITLLQASYYDDNEGYCTSCPYQDLMTYTKPGIPLHTLQLSEGCPVVLLRNLLASDGLANGTQLKVLKISCMIECKSSNNVTYDIPRIPFKILRGTQTVYRVQFPLCLAFAMTVNKSQAKTLSKVLLNLTSEPFVHGQLYVAISRVRNKNDIVLLRKEKKPVQNIVYRSIIAKIQDRPALIN